MGNRGEGGEGLRLCLEGDGCGGVGVHMKNDGPLTLRPGKVWTRRDTESSPVQATFHKGNTGTYILHHILSQYPGVAAAVRVVILDRASKATRCCTCSGHNYTYTTTRGPHLLRHSRAAPSARGKHVARSVVFECIMYYYAHTWYVLGGV